jgi:hypothetical protein
MTHVIGQAVSTHKAREEKREKAEDGETEKDAKERGFPILV